MPRDPSRESASRREQAASGISEATDEDHGSSTESQGSLDRREFLATSAKIGITGGIAAGVAGGIAGWSPSAQAAEPCAPSVRTDSGPFYPEGAIPTTSDLVSLPGHTGRATGQILHVEGTVQDRACKPLPGASIVIWQADSKGLYKHSKGGDQNALDPHFGYFTRVITDEDGRYHIRTLVPASYRYAGLLRAPHIHIELSHGSGKGRRELITELYFGGAADDDLRAKDRVFRSRPAKSRHRLIAAKKPASPSLARSDPGALACRFDMRLP